MYALDNNSGVAVMPPVKSALKESAEPQWFTEGGNGISPSHPGQDWFNIVQAELLAVLKEGEVTADKKQFNQLTLAIKSIIAKNTQKVVNASITNKGIVQLSNNINSTGETKAATEKAVKTAYDKGVEGVNKAGEAQTAATNANNNVNNRVRKSGDTMTGNLVIDKADALVLGKRNNVNGWWVGFRNNESTETGFGNYLHDAIFLVKNDRFEINKPLYQGNNKVALEVSSFSNNYSVTGEDIDLFSFFGKNGCTEVNNNKHSNFPNGAYPWGTLLFFAKRNASTLIYTPHLTNKIYIAVKYGNHQAVWKEFGGTETYQKIGNFEITKFPNGTMIQTYKHIIPQLGQSRNAIRLTYPVAFSAMPAVCATACITAEVREDLDYDGVNMIATVLQNESNNAKLALCVYDSDAANQDFFINVIAIGSWK